MSESEIRALLRTIRADLDRALRKVVLPTALGAGIALSAGCSDDAETPHPDAKTPDAALVDSVRPDQQGVDQAVVADGAVPADQQTDQQGADSQPGWDFYPPPPYMAPDASPLYLSVERRG